MTKLESKLRNIKKQSFRIKIEEGIDEVLFSYVKKYDAIAVSSLYHFSSADYYAISEIDCLLSLYAEFEDLIS